MTIEEHRKLQYEKDGVLRIPKFFSTDEINELRRSFYVDFRKAESHQLQWRNGYPALLFYPEKMAQISKDPKLVDLVKDYLGDNVRQINCQSYVRLPGDGDAFNLHQDLSFRTEEEFHNTIESGYLQTAIVIDPMEIDNSPIFFVHGSHKKGVMKLIPRDNSEAGLRDIPDENMRAGEPMLAEPGDLLLWSVMTVHFSLPNRSNRSRMYLMNGFAKAECVKVERYPWYLKDGHIAN